MVVPEIRRARCGTGLDSERRRMVHTMHRDTPAESRRLTGFRGAFERLIERTRQYVVLKRLIAVAAHEEAVLDIQIRQQS